MAAMKAQVHDLISEKGQLQSSQDMLETSVSIADPETDLVSFSTYKGYYSVFSYGTYNHNQSCNFNGSHTNLADAEALYKSRSNHSSILWHNESLVHYTGSSSWVGICTTVA